jgi:oxygen-independent coproporphyrinogen-3 oxidase
MWRDGSEVGGEPVQKCGSASERPYQALYVHVPFCQSKCDYCAFYSIAGADAKILAAYLDRLDVELAEYAKRSVALSSIFIGGGTPSVLPAPEMDHMLTSIRRRFKLAEGCEFSMECNPESVTPEKLAVMGSLGVNRVSLGVHSFHEPLRRTLGRQGNVADVVAAREMLLDSCIRNVGMDLIFGIPGQTHEEWAEDVERACRMEIEHLSTYALTVEEGTRLAERDMDVPDDNVTVEMWEKAAAICARFGLERYEVSNLARPGRECRHNLDIWHGMLYAGCGPAAVAFDGVVRRANPPNLAIWLRGTEVEEDRLSPEARAAELLAFGLRTVSGWNLTQFRERTGYDAMAMRGEVLAELLQLRLLTLEDDCLCPTSRGLLFADLVAERLL